MGFLDHGLFGRRKLRPDEEYVPGPAGNGNFFTGRKIRKKVNAPVGGLATAYKVNTDVIKDEPEDNEDTGIPSYLRPPGSR